MSVKMRQLVEQEIVTAAINAFLAAGYEVSIDNGGGDDEYQLLRSTDRDLILSNLFLCDEDTVYVAKPGDSKHFGWAYFVYGNDGWDVLSDYTVNLELVIGVNTTVDLLSKKYE